MDSNAVIIILSLVLSAFFSGVEIAYIASNKIHIEIAKKQHDFLGKILSKLTENPSKFIATMLVGNTIALVVYGFLMSESLIMWFQTLLPTNSGTLTFLLTDWSLLSQIVISAILILITAEFLPKVFFQIYANQILKFLAIPAYVFYVLFSKVSDVVTWVSNKILKYLFKTEGNVSYLGMTKAELGNYISEQMESVESDEKLDSEIQIFQNALDFTDVKAREVMIPRTELTAISVDDSVDDLKALFVESDFSKILVFKENVDDIIGYVHSFEMFKSPKNIKSVLLPVEFIPPTMLIKDVLNVLMKKRKSIAIVIDEYGGTSGMMTIEDIIEELFGEIEDEHDTDELLEEQMDELNFKFSARLEVDYINETYKLNLPEGENYETLGGLIVDEAEEIPKVNDQIRIENYLFTILEVSTTKIDLVSLRILEED
uniref:hemolysin family protein n=1 Tax=Gelidibacter sp. TaxID=2018083 RepID=UPI00404AA72B